MAIQVKFWKFAKPDNSTKVPTATADLTLQTVNLKAPCSVVRPVLEISRAYGNGVPLYNYAYIAAFERYYRVIDWEFEEGFWLCYLDVDVLASWKTAIGSSSHYVLRSASLQDLDIRDDLYPITSKIYPFSATPTNTNYMWELSQDPNTGDLTGGCYVVGMISNSGVDYFAMEQSYFQALCNQVLNANLTSYLSGNLDIGSDLAKMIFRPFDYITRVTFIPITLADLITAGCVTSTFLTSWNLGFWTLNNLYMYKIKEHKIFTGYSKTFNLPKYPDAGGQTWLDASPYTEMWLYLPRIGKVPLDTTVLAGCSTLDVNLSIDPITGQCIYDLEAYQSNYPGVSYPVFCGRYTTQLGVSVELTQNEITLANVLDYATGAISGIATAAAGNPVGVAGAVGSIQKALEPHVATVGDYGGVLDMEKGYVALYGYHRILSGQDPADNGRPLCKQKTINTLTGYVQCLDGKISINDAFKEEINKISGYLTSGFFYE